MTIPRWVTPKYNWLLFWSWNKIIGFVKIIINYLDYMNPTTHITVNSM